MDQARLKYRIVGGIVLVALAAILVPVLNDMRQPLPLGPQAIDIPAEPTDGVAGRLPVDAPPLEGSFPEPQDIPPPLPPPPLSEEGGGLSPDAGTDLVPTAPPPVQAKPPAPVARAPVPSVASKPPVAKPAPTPAPTPVLVARPAPTPVAKPAAPAAPPPPPAVAAPTPAAAVQQAWVVQLGVFGNLKTAIDLREQLRKAGYSAFTEEITTPQGKALRVRVGPELNRATAQAVRDRLARETGQDGIVVAYP